MKTTKAKAVSITMPVEMYKDAETTAKAENRTFSELVREALRRYNWEKLMDEANAYGGPKAQRLGLTEKDVVPLIKQMRKEEHQRKNH